MVTCKGRLAYLAQTLPLLLEQQCAFPFRVIVVDYGDPDKAFAWCRQFNHPRLVALRILDDVANFNLSRARNCGANALRSDALCFVDADSLLHRDFMEFVSRLVSSGRAALTRRDYTDGNTTTFGVCCVRTTTYHRARGYDETFEGWGAEDHDFYTRVARHGPVLPFPAWLYTTTIPHSDADRTRYYQTKDRMQSAQRVVPKLYQPDRRVNPAGYGRAAALLSLPERRDQILECQISEPAAKHGNEIEPSRRVGKRR